MLEEGPDGTPRLPKVPLSDDWLVYKNYVDFQVEPSKAIPNPNPGPHPKPNPTSNAKPSPNQVEPSKATFRNSLCTPYMSLSFTSQYAEPAPAASAEAPPEMAVSAAE